jgi:hypothetical protein
MIESTETLEGSTINTEVSESSEVIEMFSLVVLQLCDNIPLAPMIEALGVANFKVVIDLVSMIFINLQIQ